MVSPSIRTSALCDPSAVTTVPFAISVRIEAIPPRTTTAWRSGGRW
jgi:hypothetical protein